MAINDILPQVDPVPGLGTDRRVDKPAFATDVAAADSSYQRALSRSLNDRGRQEPPTSERTTRSENAVSPSAEERPAPQPNDRPTPTRATDETNESNRPQPTPRTVAESENERAEAAEVATPEKDTENDDSATHAVNAAAVVISIQPPPAEISTGDYQEIKPPANLVTLFATITTDDQYTVEATAQNVETTGDETLRPPSGLFETLAVNKGEQPSAAEGQQAETPQILPDAAIDTETQNQNLLPTDQSAAANSTAPHNAETSNIFTDARSENVGLTHPTDIDAALANPAGGADSAIAAPSTDSSQTPDGTSLNAAPSNSNAPASVNPQNAESPQSARLTQADETNRHRSDQERTGAAAEGPSIATEESAGSPQATSASNSGLLNDNSSGRRSDIEHRTEQNSDSDASRPSVTAVRTDSGRTTIPVPSSPSSPSPTNTLPVDPEQLVERVATGIRTAPSNGQQLRVKLYPPHLGQLQIEVNSNSGTVSVRLEVQNVAAQNALNDNMSLLREALVHQGTSIDRIDIQLVETNAEDGRSDLTDEQQQQPRQEADDQSPNRDEQEQGKPEESETNRQPVAATHTMDEIDIQV